MFSDALWGLRFIDIACSIEMTKDISVAWIITLKTHLPGLQILRGIAATAVVVHHGAGWLHVPGSLNATIAELNLGARGVELFFVLSGFIIYYVHRGDPGGMKALLSFARKRIDRIFPLTFILSTLYFVQVNAAELMSNGALRFGWETWASSALIIPALERPLPVVIWTLRHELFFYLIFTLYFLNRKAMFGALILWTLSALLFQVHSADAGAAVYLYVLAGQINALFLIGLCVAMLLVRRAELPFARLNVLVATLAFCLSPLMLATDVMVGLSPTLIYGLISGYAVLAYCSLSRPVPVLNLLGDASFSIYLVHLPLFSFAKLIADPVAQASPFLGLVVLSGLAITGGVAVHILIERPLLRLMKNRSRSLSEART